ncbi:MAG: hypothetical protein AAGI63_15850 [Planctomycetota bacterium]
MNRQEDPSNMLPHECQQTRRWLTGEITELDDDSIECHLAECSSCLDFAEQLDEESRPIQADAARLQNEAITAPSHLRRLLVTRDRELADQDREPRSSIYLSLSREERSSRPNRRALLAVCTSIVIVLSSLWMIERSLRQDEGVETAVAFDANGSTPDDVTEQPDTDQDDSELGMDSEIAMASAIAAEGYVIAVESTGQDEIPFFWVLPEPQETTQP